MKKIVFIISGLLLSCFCSCKKEHVNPINQLVKDLFCFNEGSEWIYYDSISQTVLKMVITSYKETRLAPTPKGGRKAYDFVEYIKIKGLFEKNEFEVRIKAEMYEDNTAIFSGKYLSPHYPLFFVCNAENNFKESRVSYFSKYQSNGVEYKDVYAFDCNNITYYVAKNIGIILFTQTDILDLVLINKNIQR